MKRNLKPKKRGVYIFLVVVIIFILLIIGKYTLDSIPLTGKAFEDGQRVQQCLTNDDCNYDTNCRQGVCGACLSNDDCTLIRPRCSNDGMCTGCNNDQDCPQDYTCNEGAECEFRSGACQRDEQCTDFQVCDNNRCLTAEGNSCISDAQCASGMMCDTGYCYPLCRDNDGGINFPVLGAVEYGRVPIYDQNEVTIGYRLNRDSRDSCRVTEVFKPGQGDSQEHLQLENFCDIEGLWGGVAIECPGRKQCVEGMDSCTSVALAGERAACTIDEECALGLVCERNICQRLQPWAQFGRIVPNTLGRPCQNDNDCRGNVENPAVVCEDNVCMAGAGSDCRTGCSMRYPCTQICSVSHPCINMFTVEPSGETMCGPLAMQNGLTPVGELCQSHDNCISGACINSYYPLLLGRCEERLRGAGQQCFTNNDCKSDNCAQNVCQGAVEFEGCTNNADCDRSLTCRDGLCLKRNVQETALSEKGCEQFRELIPGQNNPQQNRINLVFVLVNAPEDLLIRQKLTRYINFRGKDGFGKNSLFNVEPFKSNKDQFNLWYVNEIQQVSPPTTPQKCFAACDNPQKETASCSLKNKETANVCFMSCRGYTKSSTFQPTGLDSQGNMNGGTTLTHELGHSIGGLRDEYVEEKNSYTTFPNCAATVEQGKQWWGDLEGRGTGDLQVRYVNGCSYSSENIKPVKNSIMYNSRAAGFGDVNYRHLCYQILKNTKKVDATCLRAITAAPRDAHHEMYTKALEGVTGSVVADAPTKRKSVTKPKMPAPKSTSTTPNPGCNQNSVCDKKKGETQFTCPTDCGETTVDINLQRKALGTYEIGSYTVVERVPYLPYFEDSGIFEAQLTINSGNQMLTKYFNLRTPEITETFTDGPTVPPGLRGNDNIMIEDLQWGGIKLDDYKLVYENELSIYVPLKGIPLSNQFRITLNSPTLGVSQSFTCQQGTCQEEFSK